ncbi:MAG: hypothetical protein IBJ04_01995 [Hydrogenophaga sp.]|uniref:hypothetical protein n=1 Tax=Hydrogenophaga sp. TaxID=1904254 RepID=UPI002580915F|nr:hypothetical protein [Hydrogenophaga sp.]MBL0943087.1 hypothetical protein [Hydrogenophaga sp.]
MLTMPESASAAARDDPHLLSLPWISAGRMRLLRGDVLRFRPDPLRLGLQVAVFEWRLGDGGCRRVTLGVHQRPAQDWLQGEDDALVLIEPAGAPGWAAATGGLRERVRLTEGGGFAYHPLPGFVGREAFAYLDQGRGESRLTHVTISLQPPLH